MVKADKSDAGDMISMLDENEQNLNSFSHIYPDILQGYLDNLNSQTLLNVERTKNVWKVLIVLKRFRRRKTDFELTAPTGSGKTLMLLSLASEIIKSKGAKRIIYGLPFCR